MQVELGHSIGAAVLPHLQVLPVEVLILAPQLQVLLFCRIHLEATYLGWQSQVCGVSFLLGIVSFTSKVSGVMPVSYGNFIHKAKK